MTLQEIKDVHVSKYIEKEFQAKLLEIVIKPKGDNDQVVFVVEGAEEPQELTLWGIDKVKDGNINDYCDLGSVIASMRKLGYKPLMDIEGKVFKTDPAIVGKVIHMKPTREYVKDGKKYPGGWIIEEIKDNGKTIVAPDTPPQAQKPAGLTPELKQKWETILIDNLVEPLNEAGIQGILRTVVPDTATREPLAKVRKLALQELLKDGKLSINDKAQYSVA